MLVAPCQESGPETIPQKGRKMNKLFESIKGHCGHFSIMCGIVTALMSFPLAAQETKDAQAATDEPIEEIITVGIRPSLELALTNKRNADSIIDGIAAEGIGRFPDLNLADSLSRVTGVQLDSSGPSGERREGQIAVRGLPNNFAKTLVNGQTLASPNFNGGFAFGIFESDVVSAINVVKSPTAKYDEGGLSGIVDIKTLRPLSIREPFFTTSVEADYESLSEDVVPNASVSWGHKFRDDSIGVFASLKWSDQQFRTDSARINGYDNEDTDGDGLADLFTPNEARYNSRQNEGEVTGYRSQAASNSWPLTISRSASWVFTAHTRFSMSLINCGYRTRGPSWGPISWRAAGLVTPTRRQLSPTRRSMLNHAYSMMSSKPTP
jgi:outer membrane cobalamin receptor